MKLLICVFIISIGMASCHHVYYAPNTSNIPLFSDRNQVRINGLYSNGDVSSFKGGEAQVAASLTDKWAAMANFFSASNTDNTGSYDESGRGSYFEFAGGYFKTIDRQKKWVGEIYAGFGGGNVMNDYGLGDHSKVGITKFFLQPNIGYKSKFFEFGFSPKISLVNWKVKDHTVSNTEHDWANSDLGFIKSDPNFLAFEPALLVRLGSENFKIQGALSFSSSRGGILDYNELTETFNASLGISLYFNTRKK